MNHQINHLITIQSTILSKNQPFTTISPPPIASRSFSRFPAHDQAATVCSVLVPTDHLTTDAQEHSQAHLALTKR